MYLCKITQEQTRVSILYAKVPLLYSVIADIICILERFEDLIKASTVIFRVSNALFESKKY